MDGLGISAGEFPLLSSHSVNRARNVIVADAGSAEKLGKRSCDARNSLQLLDCVQPGTVNVNCAIACFEVSESWERNEIGVSQGKLDHSLRPTGAPGGEFPL